MTPWQSYLTDVQCTGCLHRFPSEQVLGVCPDCGRVLLANYDLERLRLDLSPAALADREWSIWRYRELLPVRDPAHVVSLGEGMTPLVRVSQAAAAEWGLDRGELQVKDESQNPTGTFKARGLSVAISKARELGAREVALPSAGNAGSAAAAYGAAAGLRVHIAVPRDVPIGNRIEAFVYRADVLLVDGLIGDAAQAIAKAGRTHGWYDLSTLKEPYRQEGKKTMGLELAEQGGWGAECLPDVLVYPTGGGTGIVGMAKAFDELEALGWIGSKRPRIVVVQSTGCAPLVKAFDDGLESAPRWEDARTIAAGLRVPSAIGDYLILRAVRSSGGTAVAVSDEDIVAARAAAGRRLGMYLGPEGAAALASLPVLRRNGFLAGDERVVVFNTGSGMKYDVLEWAMLAAPASESVTISLA